MIFSINDRVRWNYYRIADIFACTAMYISNAKSKLPIVRKWRATHAIVMAVVNWKYRCKSLVQVRARLSWIFSPFVDDQQRQRAKGISPFVSSRAMLPLYIHTYIHRKSRCTRVRKMRGWRQEGQQCQHALTRVCVVCYTLFSLSYTCTQTWHTHVRTHIRTHVYIPTVLARWATFPSCTGVYPSYMTGG